VKRLIFLAATLFAAMITANAQGAAAVVQDSWPRIAPAEESFTVLMPKSATDGSRRVTLPQQQSTTARVYYSVANGKRYLVASFSKTSPDRLIALSNFDHFVLNIEEGLKSEGKPLTFERDVAGARQYRISMARFSGVVRLIGTDKAFYAVMVIGGDSAGADVEKFLSSFTPGNTNTESKNVIGNGPAPLGKSLGNSSGENWSGELPPEPWPFQI
jgi:hypothetical protein